MESEINWYAEDTKPISELSIQQFESLCDKIAEQRAKIDEMAAALKEENKKLATLEAKAASYLKEMKRNSYPSAAGTVYIIQRKSVTIPRTEEDRAAFFNYLRERDLYDSMITVNSQTLNSFYRQEFEIAEQEGREASFSIPGIGEPTISETVGFKKGK